MGFLPAIYFKFFDVKLGQCSDLDICSKQEPMWPDFKIHPVVMWGNGDVSGRKTAKLALIFSLCLVALAVLAGVLGVLLPGSESADTWFPGIGWVIGIGGSLAALQMCRLSMRFGKDGTREKARKLFLYTLLYLPIILTLLAIDWM